MYAVERISSYISRGVYTVSAPFHPFGGAVDIIVVQQQDGSFKSSPWYVKFGKFQGVLKAKEKVVNISVNGIQAGFHMYLDHKGEAYFLSEVNGVEGYSGFSPPSSSDETDGKFENGRITKTQSCNFDGNQSDSVTQTQIDMGNGKIVARTSSRRSTIFGRVFGKKSFKGDDKSGKGDDNAQRISSLERAEIAADLLEVKWSTNLSTENQRRDNASTELSDPGKPHEEEVGNVQQVNDKLSLGTFNPSEHRSADDNVAQPISHETIGSYGEELVNSFGSGTVNTEDSNEISRSEYLEDREQVLEILKIETRDLGDTDEVISEIPEPETNELGAENSGFDEIKVSISETTNLDMESAGLVTQSDTEQASDEQDPLFTTGVSKEEGGERGVSSYPYFEKSESSSVGADYFSEESFESSSVPHRLCSKEVEVHSEVLFNMAELPTEAWSQAESGDNRTFKGPSEDSLGKRVSFESSAGDGGEILTESLSLLDANLRSSDSCEAEAVEVIVQDIVIERFIEDKSLKDEAIEISDNESKIHFSSSCPYSNHIVGYENRVAEVDQVIDSIKEVDSQGLHTCSITDSSIHQVQEVNNPMEKIKVHELLLPEATTINFQESGLSSISTKVENSSMPLPECLEEDQFLFDNSDNFVGSQAHCKQPTFVDAVEAENHSLLTLEGIEDERDSNDLETMSTLPSEELVQEPSPNAVEGLPVEPRTQASPISIPMKHEGNIELLFRSLPNIRSDIHDMEYSGVLHRLSRSLDLESEDSTWGFLREHFLSSSKANEGSKSNIVHRPTIDTASELLVTQSTGNHESLSTDPAVEISFCRHMLHEGMGADAASRAFDAEKVDLEKFNALGPSIVKNDRLVVRIGGRYFPWDVAGPFILGMVSFGREHIFDLKDMIAVEKAERNLKGDPSRAIVRSGGSWSIWPFNFKKSKNMSPALPAPDDAKLIAAGNARESTNDVTGDNSKNEARSLKKKVRSNTPTSEQLASLNLKDGQNVITFTFSTAMLGRQQVDARIYLWKWNTRIVVSDVDGTITKSDVLGQFMPLVGKDWSQSGVAHLFSAIKENGYQLLFLSARAISQAYLTRQFLFNLKQDGKALPDGPVVISPDGLFPSLYREVIRRAPHEFKISCLEDIRALFPPDCNPFYAGFGNRDTDEFSYIKVGIPKGKIFIINPKGQVAVNRRVDTKSYTSLHSLVHDMFPTMFTAEQEDFNSWNFWKVPPPDIDI